MQVALTTWAAAMLVVVACLTPLTAEAQDAREPRLPWVQVQSVQQLNDDDVALPIDRIRSRLQTRADRLRSEIRRAARGVDAAGGTVVVEFTARSNSAFPFDVSLISSSFEAPDIADLFTSSVELTRWAPPRAPGTGRFRVTYAIRLRQPVSRRHRTRSRRNPGNCIGRDLDLNRLTRDGHCLVRRNAETSSDSLVVEVPRRLTISAGDIVRVPIVITNRSRAAATLRWREEMFVAETLVRVSRAGEDAEVRGCDPGMAPPTMEHNRAEIAPRGRATWTLHVPTRLCRPGMVLLGAEAHAARCLRDHDCGRPWGHVAAGGEADGGAGGAGG